MINSRKEWNLEYLVELREKFLQQEYPLDLINQQFQKAVAVNRLELIFSQSAQNKPRRRIIAPPIVTQSPANPPYRKWIQEEIQILHKNPEMKKTFPVLSVVTRQNKNIARRIIKTRIGRTENQDGNHNQPAGNFKLHTTRCMCCSRMDNDKTDYKSAKTGRTYTISRHYTCLTTHCVYLVSCGLCQAQYTGQTFRTMRDRHYGHRNEVKRCEEGLGAHFNKHAQDLNIDVQRNLDDIMQYFNLTIIASVEPDMPWSRSRLDKLESDMMERLMTMESHGGINLRIERRRGNGN